MTSLNGLANEVYDIAAEHGFHDGDENFGEKIALMHSELSEALEAHRAGKPAFYFEGRKPEGWSIELLDCAIRILDTLHAMGAGDIDDQFWAKVEYNRGRPFKHGKAY